MPRIKKAVKPKPPKQSKKQLDRRDTYNVKAKVTHSVYSARAGKKAEVALSKVYPKNSDERRAFDKAKMLVQQADGAGIAEGEKKAAQNLAAKQCEKYDIDMEDVLRSIEYDKDPYHASVSSVIIGRRDGDKTKRVIEATFMQDMADAYATKYSCRWYSIKEKRLGLRIIFFGVAVETLAAAAGFRMGYNLAVTMGQSMPGSKPRYNYLLGLAGRLWDRAAQRKLALEEAIKKAREEADSTLIVDSDGEEVEFEADFSFDMDDHEDDENGNPKWLGGTQDMPVSERKKLFDALEVHNDNMYEATEHWLESNGIKLRARKMRVRNVTDVAAFNWGREDGDLIDMGDKKIEANMSQANPDAMDEDDEDEEQGYKQPKKQKAKCGCGH